MSHKQRVVRQALRHPYGVRLSNRAIARHCGVDDKTVGRIRQAMEATAEVPQLNKRLVKKANGEIYEIDTTHIGARPTQPTGPSSKVNSNGYQTREALASARTKLLPDQVNSNINSSPTARSHCQLNPQEFKCPRCGTERIVGVNGSRRWCLNCAAEWPTAALFLAEVKDLEARKVEHPTPQQLQNRFLTILAQLDGQDVHLSQISTWLDTLEAQLNLVETPKVSAEAELPINLIPVKVYA